MPGQILAKVGSEARTAFNAELDFFEWRVDHEHRDTVAGPFEATNRGVRQMRAHGPCPEPTELSPHARQTLLNGLTHPLGFDHNTPSKV
jgi:hypothetical protein